jgi:hypothetical protein
LRAREGKKRGGSVPKYGKEEGEVFQVIWMAAEQPCGKRMKPTVKVRLSHYEKLRSGTASWGSGSPARSETNSTAIPCRV